MSDGGPEGLVELALQMGIAPTYVDLRGASHQVPPTTLQALVAAMGLAADDEHAVADSTRAHHQARWSALVDPTTVCWLGDGPSVVLRRPSATASGVVEIVLERERGGTERLVLAGERFVEVERATVEGVDHVAQRALLDVDLPLGSHQVHVFDGARTGSGHLLVAPRRAPAPGRGWGCSPRSTASGGRDRSDRPTSATLATWPTGWQTSAAGWSPPSRCWRPSTTRRVPTCRCPAWPGTSGSSTSPSSPSGPVTSHRERRRAT